MEGHEVASRSQQGEEAKVQMEAEGRVEQTLPSIEGGISIQVLFFSIARPKALIEKVVDPPAAVPCNKCPQA